MANPEEVTKSPYAPWLEGLIQMIMTVAEAQKAWNDMVSRNEMDGS